MVQSAGGGCSLALLRVQGQQTLPHSCVAFFDRCRAKRFAWLGGCFHGVAKLSESRGHFFAVCAWSRLTSAVTTCRSWPSSLPSRSGLCDSGTGTLSNLIGSLHMNELMPTQAISLHQQCSTSYVQDSSGAAKIDNVVNSYPTPGPLPIVNVAALSASPASGVSAARGSAPLEPRCA